MQIPHARISGRCDGIAAYWSSLNLLTHLKGLTQLQVCTYVEHCPEPSYEHEPSSYGSYESDGYGHR